MDVNQEKIIPEVKDRFPTRFKRGHKSPIEGFVFNDAPDATKWTPELRKQKEVEKRAESKAKRPSWTEEKRKAAAERVVARNLKAKDDEERMRRRRMTRYVKDTFTGRIHAWMDHFAGMERMQDLGYHDPKYTDVSKL